MSEPTEIKETALLDEDDYLEELSSESSSLTPTAFRAILMKRKSSSQSSGVGSLGTDTEQQRMTGSSNDRTVYVDTTTDLPEPTPKVSGWRISAGSLIMFLSVASFVYTPYELLLNERLKMIPGFPAYDWWIEPPDEVLLKVYVFNVTNSEAFLSGEDVNIKMDQVGPFIYQEKLVHTDVVFNDNGTLTYTAHRSAVFMPHLTNISLNATLIVPNLAVLGGASFLSDSSFITKIGFNMMVSRTKAHVFSTVSAQDYMWNWTDPLIDMGRKLVPFMVPVDNMGVLNKIYSDFVDRVTVYIGTEDPRRFFLIDQYRGSDRLGYWDDERCDACQGSTEGVTYPQFLTRNDSIVYLRKTICQVATLHYARDVNQNGIEAYRWELPPNRTFHRPPEGTEDCFTRPGARVLPSGVSDVSPCYFQYPIAVSLPHFLGAVPNVEPRLEGMNPTDEEHGSYVIIEPITGIPMESRARSQCNLAVKSLSGFSSNITKFSEMILPMFWLEYGQQGLPNYVRSLVYFTAVLLPASQHWVSLFFLLAGFSLFISGVSPYLLYVLRHFAFKYHKLEKLSLSYFR